MNGSGASGRKTTERKTAPAAVKKGTRTIAGIVFGILGQGVLILLMVVVLVACIGGGLVGGGVYGIIKSTPALNPETLKVRNFNSYIYDIKGNINSNLEKNHLRTYYYIILSFF